MKTLFANLHQLWWNFISTQCSDSTIGDSCLISWTTEELATELGDLHPLWFFFNSALWLKYWRLKSLNYKRTNRRMCDLCNSCELQLILQVRYCNDRGIQGGYVCLKEYSFQNSSQLRTQTHPSGPHVNSQSLNYKTTKKRMSLLFENFPHWVSLYQHQLNSALSLMCWRLKSLNSKRTNRRMCDLCNSCELQLILQVRYCNVICWSREQAFGEVQIPKFSKQIQIFHQDNL